MHKSGAMMAAWSFTQTGGQSFDLDYEPMHSQDNADVKSHGFGLYRKPGDRLEGIRHGVREPLRLYAKPLSLLKSVDHVQIEGRLVATIEMP